MPTITDLAAELRNRIYELALPHGCTYRVNVLSPPLCQASSEIRKDSFPIWRHQNTYIWHLNQYGLQLTPKDYHFYVHYMNHLKVIIQLPNFLQIDIISFAGAIRDPNAIFMDITGGTYTFSRCHVEKQGNNFRLIDICLLPDVHSRVHHNHLVEFEFMGPLQVKLQRRLLPAVYEEVIECEET
ncbi:hypothetical protein LTR37_001616 [Vermiconidia calcicola]|uniref:Uncharacterized protein n=1 Tax=Vermiconidia calcicola TaxID=1690605 RepID=A0ACC3NVC0_9PEZI|nr:hypothetical protein LTR37_001616 [Vermiconidia calcicola]